jgi:hypothetical protein
MSTIHQSDQAAYAPAPTRGRRFRYLGVFVAMAALVGLGLTTAAPASAEVGYDISYSVRNDTTQTLYFVSAVSPGAGCDEYNLHLNNCPNPDVDHSFRVSPKVVKPGEAIGVYSKADLLGRDKYFIKVTFEIGTTKASVVLFANRSTPDYDDKPHTCHITAKGRPAGHFECDVIPAGRERDFILRQVA